MLVLLIRTLRLETALLVALLLVASLLVASLLVTALLVTLLETALLEAALLIGSPRVRERGLLLLLVRIKVVGGHRHLLLRGRSERHKGRRGGARSKRARGRVETGWRRCGHDFGGAAGFTVRCEGEGAARRAGEEDSARAARLRLR